MNRAAWRRRGPGIAGAAVAGGLVAMAGFAPWLATHDPRAIALESELAPPSWVHWFGTGENGVDIYSAIVFGARVSMIAGGGTVLLSLAIGASLGVTAGYYGRWYGEAVMRVTDVFMAFPGILLAIAITAVTGPSLGNVILALGATGWTGYARLARGETLALREREFVVAARALGASDARVLLRHVLPNLAGPLIVQATFGLAAAILAEAGLSFLGLGVPPGTPSWGALVDAGTQYLLIAPHVSIFPGAFIFLAVLAFNLLGDALRDWLDPRPAAARH